MKLTNQQLTALVLKISREINEVNDSFNEGYLKAQETEIKRELKSNLVFLQALTKSATFSHIVYVKDSTGRSYSTVEDIDNMPLYALKNIITTKKGSLYRNKINPDSIREDLLIATIECDDLDGLIRTLKAKYEVTG